MKTLLFLLAAVLPCLQACEAALPEQDASSAWVDVKSRAGYTLSAMRLDGEKLRDGRFYQLSPGAHRLELRLGYARKGMGGGSDRLYCRVELDYGRFAAGQRYNIHAIAMGERRGWPLVDREPKGALWQSVLKTLKNFTKRALQDFFCL